MNKAEFESRLKQTFFSNGLSVYATEKNIDRFFRLSDRMLAVNAAMNGFTFSADKILFGETVIRDYSAAQA